MYFDQHNFTGKNLDTKRRGEIDAEYISFGNIIKEVCKELLDKTDNCIGVIMKPVSPVKITVVAKSTVSNEEIGLFNLFPAKYNIGSIDGDYRSIEGDYRKFTKPEELKNHIYEILQGERIRFMLEDWQQLNIKIREEADKIKEGTDEKHKS